METRHKRVISFGLWGENPRYLVGAIENVKLAPEVYPGWICRFYVPTAQEPELAKTIAALSERGAEILYWPEGIFGMYARFIVADDPTVERFIIRDTDSRLSMREAAACQQWIDSGKLLWTARDHPAHCRGLNGAMWGAVGGALPNMETLIRGWLKTQGETEFIYGSDQEFLGRHIWTRFWMHSIQHDSCCGYQDALPFPTRRENYRFMGEVFEADGTPREKDWEQVIPNQ